METEIFEHAISNATRVHLIQGERENREAIATQDVTVHVDESEKDDDRHSNNAEAYMVYSFCLKYVFVSQKQRKGALQS